MFTKLATPRSVKALGEADSDGEGSALSWVDKMRQKDEEKRMAQERVRWCGWLEAVGLLLEEGLLCFSVSEFLLLLLMATVVEGHACDPVSPTPAGPVVGGDG